ncbi:hypothetical protein [Shimia thalassica]|uniref:hypothetical protein n=1 Tax=Shimia thalassica TaxID=1715693 RepID=UPI0020908779|nr:hypothetical protein [Shimia thalassica]MDO6478585.1 hypothetical protein [Shimia thalassica]MDO6501672.1 hypothetical protein [Shimia thalassica]MDO6797873.1 hypothetical protein [Shimia thalassica]MDP2517140.1 hypothetical protein [Shimia thalassica]
MTDLRELSSIMSAEKLAATRLRIAAEEKVVPMISSEDRRILRGLLLGVSWLDTTP